MVLMPIAETPSRNHKTDSWRVQTPVVDYSKCIRCMICWKFCPDDAIEISKTGELASPNFRISKMEVPVINLDFCKGCGICAYECPEKCIDMTLTGGVTL
ncbi:MAG: 4Fe-4S binding protein [Thermoplasmataceae archaeon]